MDVKNINTTALAYMGDAVYEAEIREYLLKTGRTNVDKLHHLAIRFVKADAQAKIIKEIFEELTKEEQSLVKRARNRKFASKPKNADPITYKWATAFESLAGYLYLADQKERFRWLIDRAIEIIEEDRSRKDKK